MATEDNAHLSLAKRLAHSSDKSVRDEAFRTLSAWLEGNESADEAEYMKVWKALFYCMWYSDKVPVQQELAFQIARLTRRLHKDGRALLFLQCFFATLVREWSGLDHLRLDKFLSLTRRMLNEAFRLIAARSFSSEIVEQAVGGLLTKIVDGWGPNGIRFHIVECYLDEIAAVVPDVTAAQLEQLLAPLLSHMVQSDDKLLSQRIHAEVLAPLLERILAVHKAGDEDEDDDEAAAAAAAEDGVVRRKSLVRKGETPVLMDVAERKAAMAAAFKKTALPPLARTVFAIAALAATRPANRELLYALHREMTAAAVTLGQAKADSDCIPKVLGQPTPAAAAALAAASKRVGRKLEAAAAAPAVGGAGAASSDSGKSSSSGAAAGGAGTGSKRSRKAMEASSAASAAGKAKGKGKGRRADDDDDDEDDGEAAAEAAALKAAAAAAAERGPGKSALKGSKAAASSKNKAAAGSAKAAATSAGSAVVAAPAEAATGKAAKKARKADADAVADPMAALAAIPTIGELKKKAAAAPAPVAAAPAVAEGKAKAKGKKAASAKA